MGTQTGQEGALGKEDGPTRAVSLRMGFRESDQCTHGEEGPTHKRREGTTLGVWGPRGGRETGVEHKPEAFHSKEGKKMEDKKNDQESLQLTFLSDFWVPENKGILW